MDREVNNPDLSPLALEFLRYVQAPKVAHAVAFAKGTYNPVTQMGNPECFALFTKEELDAIGRNVPLRGIRYRAGLQQGT